MDDSIFSALERITAEKFSDLKESDIYVDDYKVLHKYPGFKGNYWEPAEPPSIEIEVTKVVVQGISTRIYDKEYVNMLLQMKAGDTFSINISFDEEFVGEEKIAIEIVEEDVKAEKVELKQIKPDEYELHVWCSIIAKGYGETPSQSLDRGNR